MPDNKRKVHFIDKNFQTKFILKFCILVALGGLLTIGILYFWAGEASTVSIVNSRVQVRSTADFILPILIQTVIIVLIIVSLSAIIVTLFVSHKISGPLYRLKGTMENLESGDFAEDFNIRRNDQLQNIAVTFDNMIKKIREALKGLKENVSLIKDKLAHISENEVQEQKRPVLTELKRLAEDLNKLLNHFKI